MPSDAVSREEQGVGLWERAFSSIGSAIGAFFRFFTRHRQPCHTCRALVIEYQTRLEEVETQFLEALSKYRAQYARLCKREKELLQQLGGLPADEGGPERRNGAQETVPGTAAYKMELRRRAQQQGLL